VEQLLQEHIPTYSVNTLRTTAKPNSQKTKEYKGPSLSQNTVLTKIRHFMCISKDDY